MFYRLGKNSEEPQRGAGNHALPPPPSTSNGKNIFNARLRDQFNLKGDLKLIKTEFKHAVCTVF